MKQLQRSLAVALALGVLAGCGQNSQSPTTPQLASPAARATGSLPQPTQTQPQGQAGPAQAEGAQLLDAVRRTFANARGFDSEVRTYTEGHYNSGSRVSELRQSTTKTRLIWMKPTKLRVEVLQTTNFLLEGAAMVTTDGQHITARAKGILGLIPLKLTATDAKLNSNRNHSFPDTNPSSQIARLTAPTAAWTVLGDGQMGSEPVKFIAVDNVRRLDNEITREVVAIEPRTLSFRELAMYAGTKRVVDHQFLKFQWNPTVGAEKFVI